MKQIFYTIALLCVCVVLFSACHKINDNTNVTVPKGLLYLHLHTDIDTAEVDENVVGRDSSGRQFSLSVAEFYMSSITLYRADGSTVTSNNVVLKTIGEEEYYVDSVPTGNYVSISFNVGLSNADNANNPTMYSGTNPLAAQTPAMYFSPSQGYIFMNIQGLADTTAAHNGPVNVPFNYQLGSHNQLMPVMMPNHDPFSVIAGQQTFVHLIADYGKVLRNINLGGTATPFNSNAAVTTQIANNIPTMFRYEE